MQILLQNLSTCDIVLLIFRDSKWWLQVHWTTNGWKHVIVPRHFTIDKPSHTHTFISQSTDLQTSGNLHFTINRPSHKRKPSFHNQQTPQTSGNLHWEQRYRHGLKIAWYDAVDKLTFEEGCWNIWMIQKLKACSELNWSSYELTVVLRVVEAVRIKRISRIRYPSTVSIFSISSDASNLISTDSDTISGDFLHSPARAQWRKWTIT